MMTNTTPAVPSLIQALHARFEACDIEYTAIEKDATDAQNNNAAMTASCFESDLIRNAILMQVPDSREDAAILLFHIRIAHDNTSNETNHDNQSDEAKALTIAIDTLFDFMASEKPEIDHELVGKEFQRACNVTHFARRHRTGDMI